MSKGSFVAGMLGAMVGTPNVKCSCSPACSCMCNSLQKSFHLTKPTSTKSRGRYFSKRFNFFLGLSFEGDNFFLIFNKPKTVKTPLKCHKMHNFWSYGGDPLLAEDHTILGIPLGCFWHLPLYICWTGLCLHLMAATNRYLFLFTLKELSQPFVLHDMQNNCIDVWT